MLYEVITTSEFESIMDARWRWIESATPRITSYNVCYTKLLRTGMSALSICKPSRMVSSVITTDFGSKLIAALPD